jgi:hypothetical protein
LLWKYYDTQTCQRVGKGFDRAICLYANNEQDCAKVLHRVFWLPSYDEWDEKVDLTEIQKIDLNHIGKQSSHVRNSTMKLADRLGRFQTIEFPQMLGQNAKVLKNPDIRNSLRSEETKRRSLALFDYGVDYLYGFLFHEIFGFQPSVRSSIPLRWDKNLSVENKTIYRWQKWNPNKTLNMNSSTRKLTVALHSRHPKESDDGTNIGWEKECIQKILQQTVFDNNINYDEKDGPLVSDYICTVVLLSDRQKTIDKLAKYLKRHHCTAVVASHEDLSDSWREEHGPYAGIGFYQDLWLVHNQVALMTEKQQIAFIGHNHRRTSSTLIREVLVHSYKTNHNKNRTQTEDDILTCFQEDVKKTE